MTALILVIMTRKKTMISRTPKLQAKKTQKKKKRLRMTKVKTKIARKTKVKLISTTTLDLMAY